MASCTVLCDHLLMPVDEVRALRASHNPLLTPHSFLKPEQARSGRESWSARTSWNDSRSLRNILALYFREICLRVFGFAWSHDCYSERALPHHIPVLASHR